MAKSALPENFKDDVLASSMGGKRRYKLIHNSDGTVSLEDATTYTQVGSNFGALQVNATNRAVNASLATDGNGSNIVNTFSQASARSNLATGEKLSVSLGKIMKWFVDLKDAAFRGVANNLTTSSSGSNVLDAYQGYLLNNNKANNSNIIDTLADVIANTQSKKPAGSLALKAAYNELNGKLLHAKNTSQSGWRFYRVGNLVFFTHNKTLSAVAANTKYTNQGKAPTGYRPAERYYAAGVRSVGVSTVTGDFYFELAVDGTAIFISTASHSEAQSYTVSGCYVTTDAFPTADKV